MFKIQIRTLDSNNSHTKPFAHARLRKRLTVSQRWSMNFGNGKAIIEFYIVHHPPADQMGNTFPHVCLWINHMVSANPLSNFAVFNSQCLHPDILDTKFCKCHHRHQTSS